MKKVFRKVLACCMLAAALLFPAPAAAHRPDWGSTTGVTHIDDISISYAFYRELTQPHEVHAYAFSAEAGQHLHAGISIPAIDRLKAYNVTMALFGPGLPEVTEALHDTLPENHPEGIGVLLVEPGVSEDYFEPFTQTSLWGRQTLEMDLPESGEYTLLVWNAAGQIGKYVLDTGREEVFALADVLRFPVWWVRVRLYFEQGMYLALGALALLAGLGLIIWRRRRITD